MRHIRLTPTMKAGEFVIRLVGSTEIEALLEAGDITDRQCDAGACLAYDRYASGISGKGSSWHGAGPSVWRGSYYEQMDENMEAAWRRYSGALKSLPATAAHEVEGVVILNLRCSDLRALRKGLDLLAAYYTKNPASTFIA